MSKINETNYPRRTQASYEDTDMLVIQKSGGNTYTTRIEDLREDYEETLAPTLSALQDDINENLATIEGSTASKVYAKGDFLVFGGRLCKAKTSIASGATLVLDTNIKLDSVGDELSSLSSDIVNLSDSKSIYTWSSGTLDSSIVLNEAYTHFKYLLFVWQTNSQRYTQLVPTDFIPLTSREITQYTAAPNAQGLVTNVDYYQAYSSIVFTDTTHATQYTSWSNGNWILKLINIVGICRIA